MKKALVFPGQGSQIVGMGKDFYDNFSVAKKVFDEVDDALNFKLSDIIFNGPEEELTATQNAQPALMAVSMAIWRVFQQETGLDITDFTYVAGHSLGEYSALCAAKALSLSDTARLLQRRGIAMAKATQIQKGSMAAILGLNIASVQKLAEETQTFVTNDNSIGQVVISGAFGNIEKACEKAKEMGAKRALMLNVAGAFHCPLMQTAAEEMKPILDEVSFNKPVIPVVANVLASSVNDAEQIKQLLYKQITGQVRWTETVQWLERQNVAEIIELGAGKVLSGLVKKTSPEMQVFSINDILSLEEFKKTI